MPSTRSVAGRSASPPAPRTGRSVTLNLLGPGDVFGEIALLDGHARTAEAIALETTDLFVIDRRDFLELLAHDAALAARIIGFLCRRLRWMSERMEEADAPSPRCPASAASGYAVRGLRRRNPGDTARTRRLRWRGAGKRQSRPSGLASIRHHRSWALTRACEGRAASGGPRRASRSEAAEGIHPMRNLARVVTAFAAVVVPVTVHAQTRCTETTRFDPPLRILRCTDGLTLEAERAARYGRWIGTATGSSRERRSAARRTRDPADALEHAPGRLPDPHPPRDCLRARHDLRRRCDHRKTAVFVARAASAVARRNTPAVFVTLAPG